VSDLLVFLDRLTQPYGVRLTSEAGLYVLVVLPLLWLSARGVKGEGPRWYVRIPLLAVRTAGVLAAAAAMLQPIRIDTENHPEAAVAVDVTASVPDAELGATAARLAALAGHPSRGAAPLHFYGFDRSAFPLLFDPKAPSVCAGDVEYSFVGWTTAAELKLRFEREGQRLHFTISRSGK